MLSPADLVAGKLLVQLGDVPLDEIRRQVADMDADPEDPWDLVSRLVAAGLLPAAGMKRIRRYVALFWRVRQAAVALWLVERRHAPGPGQVDELLARFEGQDAHERLSDLLVSTGLVDRDQARALEDETQGLLEAENRRLVEGYRADGFAGLARPLIPLPVVDEAAFRVSILFRDASTRQRVDELIARGGAARPAPPAGLALSSSWEGTWEDMLQAHRSAAPGLPAGEGARDDAWTARTAVLSPSGDTARMDPAQVLSPPAGGTVRMAVGEVLAPPGGDPRETLTQPAPSTSTTVRRGSRWARTRPAIPQPETIGAYQVLQLIGAGAMGAVYLCSAPNGGMVAVKTILVDRADEDDRARFEREVAVCGLLRHPNTVGLVARGETAEGLRYLVMPPYVGRTLRELLKERGALPVELALHYLEEILVGLTAIHAAGVVHRDIKPDNVVVLAGQEERRIKIVDFGIARPIDDGCLPEDARFRTVAGILTGSPGYVAPETVTGDPIDGRTDLYSLGVTLYELLTGRAPFTAETPGELLLLHLAGEPVPLEAAAPEVPWPPELERLVAQLLARERDDRPASAQAVLERLRGGGLRARILTALEQATEESTPRRSWLGRLFGRDQG